MLFKASRMTRMTFVSLADSKLHNGSRQPFSKQWDTWITLPPDVRFVMAQAASFWVLNSPWNDKSRNIRLYTNTVGICQLQPHTDDFQPYAVLTIKVQWKRWLQGDCCRLILTILFFLLYSIVLDFFVDYAIPFYISSALSSSVLFHESLWCISVPEPVLNCLFCFPDLFLSTVSQIHCSVTARVC